MAATRRASKFIYEIQAEYSGERDLRRLQDDLTALSRIEAWKKASDRYRELNDQLREARNNVAELQRQYEAGGSKDKKLARQIQNAQRDIVATERAIEKQREAVDKARANMNALGIVVGGITQRYQQLKAAAQAAGRALAARNTLGVRSDSDIRAEMEALKRAYRDVATSGTASTRELQRAAEQLRGRIRELRTELQGVNRLDLARSNLGIRADSAIRAEMDALRRSYRELATSGTASTRELQRAAEQLRTRIRELRTELQGVGKLDLARSTLGIRADSAIRAEMDALRRSYRELATSGTASTRELQRAAEQLRTRIRELRTELQGVGKLDLARSTLGIRADSAIRAEMDALRKSYRDLATSGTASTRELQRAAEQLRTRIRELRTELQGVGKLDLARSTLGIRADSAIRAEMDALRKSYRDLATSGTASTRELQRAAEQLRTRIRELRTELQGVGKLDLARSTLGIRADSAIRAEMDALRRSYRELATSGTASTRELERAAEQLRTRIRALRQEMQSGNRLDLARNVLGIRGDAEITAQINRLRRAYQDLARSGTASAAELRRAWQAMNQQIATLQGQGQGISALAGRLTALKATLAGLATAFATTGLLNFSRGILSVADDYAALDARIRLTVESEKEAVRVREELFRLSQASGAPYAGNVEAYARLAMSMKEAGVSAQQTIRIVDIANKTLSLNGSTAGNAAAFMLQFSQAMASGRLQGDEFNSMMENNGVFAAKMAKALGVTIGVLRQMSRDGKLTRDVLLEVFTKIADEVDKEFAQTPMKVSGALQSIRNEFEKLVNDANKSAGGTESLVKALTDLRELMEQNAGTIREWLALLIRMSVRIVQLAVDVGKWAAAHKEGIGAFVDGLREAERFLNPFAALFNAVFGGKGRAALSSFAADVGTVLAPALKAASDAASRLDQSLRVLSTRYAELRRTQADIDRSRQEGLALQERQRQMYARISEETGVVIKSHRDLMRAVDDGKIHWDDATRRWVAGAAERAEAEKKAAAATGKELDKLVKQYEQTVGKIRELQDQIVGRQKSLEAELRGMRREGMSDLAAWKDQRAEADEYVEAAKRAAAAAKEAAAAGDSIGAAAKWKEAVQYADDAKAAYKGLNKEVKQGDDVVISKADALKTAMEGVEEAGKLGIDILRQQQDAAQDTLKALEEKSGFAGLQQKISEAEQKWLDSWQKMRVSGVEAVQAVDKEFDVLARQATIVEEHWAVAALRTKNVWVQLSRELKRELDEATKPRTVTVYTATGRRLGGLVEGPPSRFARGGRVPGGYGGGDRIPAMLESGEFVLRKEAVKHWGADLLSRLNRLVLPDFSAFLPAPAVAAGPSMTLELKLPGGEAVAATVSGEDAERLRRWNRRVSNLRFTR